MTAQWIDLWQHNELIYDSTVWQTAAGAVAIESPVSTASAGGQESTLLTSDNGLVFQENTTNQFKIYVF